MVDEDLLDSSRTAIALYKIALQERVGRDAKDGEEISADKAAIDS